MILHLQQRTNMSVVYITAVHVTQVHLTAMYTIAVHVDVFSALYKTDSEHVQNVCDYFICYSSLIDCHVYDCSVFGCNIGIVHDRMY